MLSFRSTAGLRGAFKARPLYFCAVRFVHKKSGGNAAELEAGGDSTGDSNNKLVPNKKQQKDVFQITSKTTLSAPAPMSNEIGNLMKREAKPYVPKLSHERLTYEYPGLPNEDNFASHTNLTTAKPVGRWSKLWPKLMVVAGFAWGAYAIKVWFFAPQEESDSKELLDPDHFHKFIITHKMQIDKDHYLIEIKPKYHNWQYSYYAHYDNKTIWNGDRIWSVEVKQPEIMVVRSYTPLPLYFMKSERTRSGEKEPLLRVVNNDTGDHDKGGVMTLYIKRYDSGEVSRYIVDKDVGEELEIRGPHVEYKFPHHPLKALHTRPIFHDLPSKVEAETLVDNIKQEHGVPDYDNMTFYAAGTGIAPILQVLFSRNPYRGFVTLHYSAQSPTELGPLRRFLFFLEKLDRLKTVDHIDTEPATRLSPSDINKPHEPNYISPMRAELREAEEPESSELAYARRKAMLEGQEATPLATGQVSRPTHFANALEQARYTATLAKTPAALALVCGPGGYVVYVAGRKLANTNEQGPVEGVLGAKGWDHTNVYKL